MRNIYKTAAIGVMVVGLAGATGCATTGDLNKLQAEVDRVSAVANQAAADAAAAKSAAAAAQSSADAAQACCDANTEKMDRMFKKSMNK
jgi:murein lipoprotein